MNLSFSMLFDGLNDTRRLMRKETHYHVCRKRVNKLFLYITGNVQSFCARFPCIFGLVYKSNG